MTLFGSLRSHPIVCTNDGKGLLLTLVFVCFPFVNSLALCLGPLLLYFLAQTKQNK